MAAAPQYIASPKSDVSVAGFQIDVEPCDLQIAEFLLSVLVLIGKQPTGSPSGQQLRINANYILAIQ